MQKLDFKTSLQLRQWIGSLIHPDEDGIVLSNYGIPGNADTIQTIELTRRWVSFYHKSTLFKWSFEPEKFTKDEEEITPIPLEKWTDKIQTGLGLFLKKQMKLYTLVKGNPS